MNCFAPIHIRRALKSKWRKVESSLEQDLLCFDITDYSLAIFKDRLFKLERLFEKLTGPENLRTQYRFLVSCHCLWTSISPSLAPCRSLAVAEIAEDDLSSAV